jgi:hypothetical protein
MDDGNNTSASDNLGSADMTAASWSGPTNDTSPHMFGHEAGGRTGARASARPVPFVSTGYDTYNVWNLRGEQAVSSNQLSYELMDLTHQLDSPSAVQTAV